MPRYGRLIGLMSCGQDTWKRHRLNPPMFWMKWCTLKFRSTVSCLSRVAIRISTWILVGLQFGTTYLKEVRWGMLIAVSPLAPAVFHKPWLEKALFSPGLTQHPICMGVYMPYGSMRMTYNWHSFGVDFHRLLRIFTSTLHVDWRWCWVWKDWSFEILN